MRYSRTARVGFESSTRGGMSRSWTGARSHASENVHTQESGEAVLPMCWLHPRHNKNTLDKKLKPSKHSINKRKRALNYGNLGRIAENAETMQETQLLIFAENNDLLL